MELFKNKVGRPSNETIRKRRTVYVLIFVAVIGIIGTGVFYVRNIFNNNAINSRSKNAAVQTNTIAKSGDVASEIKLGSDGKITVEDLYIIQRLAAGETINGKTKDTLYKTGTKNKLADIDGNGEIDDIDIKIASLFVLKLQYIMKSSIKDVNLGDINKNGIYDQEDVDKIKHYIKKMDTTFSESQTKLADVNKDGKVDDDDVDFLTKFVVKLGMCKNGKTNIDAKLGDVNCDGKLDSKDVDLILKYSVSKIQPNKMQKKQSDIDGDEYIEPGDSAFLNDIINTGKSYSIGDINNDNKINSKDVDILDKYLSKNANFNALQLDLADVNRDRKVTAIDKTILERIVAGYGDVCNAYNSGGDGKFTLEDYELINYNIGDKISTTSNNDVNNITNTSELLNLSQAGLNNEQKQLANLTDIDVKGTISQKDLDLLYDKINNRFIFIGTKKGVKVDYNRNTQILSLNGTASGNIGLYELFNQKFKVGNEYKITLEYVSGTVTSKDGKSGFVTEVRKQGDSNKIQLSKAVLRFPTSASKTTTKTFTVNSNAEKYGNELYTWIWKNNDIKFTNYKVKVSIQKTISPDFSPKSKKSNDITIDYNKSSKTLSLNGTATGDVNLYELLNQKFKVGDEYQITLEYVSGTVTSKDGKSGFVTEVRKQGDSSKIQLSKAALRFPTSASKPITQTFTVSSDTGVYGNELYTWIWKYKDIKFINYKVKVKITNKSIVNSNVLTAVFEPNGSKGEKKIVTCNTLGNDSCTIKTPDISPADGFNIIGWNSKSNATEKEYKVSSKINIKGSKIYYAITKSNDYKYISLNPGTGKIENKGLGQALSYNVYSYNGNNYGVFKFPTLNKTNDKQTILGWSTVNNASVAAFKQNDIIKVNVGGLYYGIVKEPITITFNKGNADSLSFYQATCISYGNGCKLEKYPAIYSSGNIVVGFTLDSNDSNMLVGLNKIYSSNKTLYAVCNDSFKDSTGNRKKVNVYRMNTILDKPIYFEGMLDENNKLINYIEDEKGIKIGISITENDATAYYNYLLKVSEKMPYLFLDKSPLNFLTGNTFDDAWGDWGGMAYLAKYESMFTNTDVKTYSLFSNYSSESAIHELGHAADNYYKSKKGYKISEKQDIKKMYEKYNKMSKKTRPMRDYSYTNTGEFVADMFVYYYYYKYKPEGKNIPPGHGGKALTYEMAKVLEKYINELKQWV